MKHRYIYIFALITLFITSGCNDWLDVSPRQEMKEGDLFSKEEGFKDVLTGAYIKMGEANLYGRNTSIYIPEFMAHHWSLVSDKASSRYGFENFDFTIAATESMISTTWRSYYNVIVQLNNLLAAFDENEVHFSFTNEKLIKGEALALRAFLHFELLRYFGPAPLDAVAGESTIPYVTEMTRDANQLVSLPWSQVLTLIEKDFNEAEKLLLEADPIVTEETFDDDWATMYRENRFNYYAVLGAKARFYQWIGSKEKATEYARMVVDAEKKNGDPVIELTFGDQDLIMYNEMLFGVHNPKHQAIVEPLFKGETASLFQDKNHIAIAYESGTHNDDRRRPERYWKEVVYSANSTIYHFNKYLKDEDNKFVNTLNAIPVLRLSEMYFILIENEPLDVANERFIEFRIARNMRPSIDNSLTDEQAVKERLEIEYRKDFFGEGQMFFFYKRLKYETYTWPPKTPAYTVPADAYRLPVPKEQIAFE